MQNTPQTFRNTSAPGVNFTEHAYENHLGSHCPPNSYQPYHNSPYPVPSSRPHHYGNPQMQPNMPYRHHGGAYAPNHSQYAAGMNQEVYRNHHSGYVGANNRNMPSKPWSENNSPDLMPPYGQVTSHPQMMNNSPQMPVTSMRSPPQATSNMNPAASQGQQHYRPMQSPAHSPHSWSQAQIPSPSVMHSSRTTPSPLSTHVRSPGHSQPFSPPTAMNMQPIPPPPENGQLPQPVNSASGNDSHNPSNPLHSLQKMVMLDQDSKSSIMPLSADTEQFGNQCGSHNYVPEESASNESKDSAYSTYYNMDENRFESKPNNTDNDTSVYSSVQQVSNCNFPITSNPVGHDDSNSTSIPQCGPNSNAPEGFLSDQSNVSLSKSTSNSEQPQCKTPVLQNDCAMQLNQCPPHAESAPIFTDQTKAAVSTNSEQALPSAATNWVNEDKSNSSNSHLAEIPNADIAGTPDSVSGTPDTVSGTPGSVSGTPGSVTGTPDSVSGTPGSVSGTPGSVSGDPGSVSESGPVSSKQSEISADSDVKVKCEQDVEIENEILDDIANESQAHSSNLGKASGESELSNCVSELDAKEDNLSQNSDCVEEIKKEKPSPAIIKLSPCSIETNVDSNDSKTDLILMKENTPEKDSKKPSLRRRKVGASYEEAPSPEQDLKSGAAADSPSPKRLKDAKSECKKSKISTINQNDSEDKSKKESLRNPVKVVIHRIRKSDTNDIWHVPGNISQEECKSEAKHQKTESKPANTSPQIIMLSSALSEKKVDNQTTSPDSNISVKQEDDDIEVIDVELTTAAVKPESTNSPQKSSSSNYSDKKRGRPVGSRNKFKPNNQLKKKRGKKGCKKRKNDLSKQKTPEVTGKVKKAKNFNGPYVHIIGSKENPSSISVVNVAQKEEEKVNKIPLKRNFNTSTVSRIKKKPVGHLSTLSPTYDAFNRDKTWLCIFCHKGSHHEGLGDLYGPYYIKDKNGESDVKNSSSSSGTSNSKAKRRKSDHDDSKCPKKARQSSGHSSGESNQGGKQGSKHLTEVELSESGEPLREVWIHEDCVVWCQSVSLMGEEVHGLEEAITEAKENICCHCKLDGATVGCWGKGCKEQYHFSCAKETGCQMDIENFSLLCPEHQKKHGRQPSPCQ
ncbi:uncharacterized protein CG5098-like [Uloborus diversus]|uniref:uncharacterized protein CG5098-like n=1 Tax=Uloborus diversus TaxID=327109 RepID=UPI00240A5A0A|nr:uncharacterized protein CG5098-like [Uloborus diversus]